jgi:hypothetical protein
MKLTLHLTLCFFCSIIYYSTNAQHNAEFANIGAVVKVQPGAIISVQGDIHNLGGTLSNDGLVEVQGNLYSDNAFQQRGVGTVRLENNDVNVGERQFISGSYSVRGGAAAIGVNDGSFFNLELANTAGLVYLTGTGNIADVRNSVDFLPAAASGTPSRNNIITHDIGLSGAFSYPANGASYTAVFGVMNPSAGNAAFVNDCIDLGGNNSTTDLGYVIGKLRRAIDPAGGIYGYILGLEPSGTSASRGFQYIHLDFQANTYDVIESYFQQGSVNNATVDLECSGYLMDVFWGDKHGEWIFDDINNIQGGDYDVKVWPQDPFIPWNGIAWTISKDDQFLWPAPNPLHNDCGPTWNGLDRGPFNGFSQFGVVSSNTFLPIELLSLSATPINNQFIRVDWATAHEEDVDYFEVQRSMDAINFQTIATHDAVGNSLVNQYYAFDDYNVLPNVEYYYRIKTFDTDASFNHTHIVVASLIPDAPFNQVVIYPNPISEGSFSVDIKSKNDMKVRINAFDAIGQLIYSNRFDARKGVNSVSVDASDWPAGAYFIHVSGNDLDEVKELIKSDF